MADRGFGHLCVHAVSYFLKRCLDGEGDHKENNVQLNRWMKICRPKEYAQYEKGKLDQKDFLNEIGKFAGYHLT